jgi:hypothetical protein
MRFQEGREQELTKEFQLLHPALRKILIGWDYYMRALFGYEVTVTDIAREKEKGGYHPMNESTGFCQAFDARTRDMKTEELEASGEYLLLARKYTRTPPGQIQHVFEKDDPTKKKTQHFHVEFDNGHPTPKT